MIQGEWEVDDTRNDGTEYRWTYSVGGSECCAGMADMGPRFPKRITWWVECYGVSADGKANTTDEMPMIRAMIEGMISTVRAYHLGDEEATTATAR